MKIALVFSITAAVNAFICPVPLCPLCPLCPVIAGAAAQGTLTAGNALLTSSIAATASVPFLLAFIDGFRTRNISFDFPSPETVYHAGETYPLFMHTFGLASRMHLRTADLYLLNSSFDRVLKIASEREFKVLHNVERSKLGVPGKGVGHLDFTLPSSLSSGVYYIKYVSGWTIWRKEGEFQAVTDGFVIAGASDAACTTVDCIQGLNQSLIRQPSSFTADDAPLELQFMFTHIPFKQVPQKFLNGVIDGVAAIPRAIVNPNLNTIKHPIEAMKNLSREWEEEEEKDPYKANGQAFGVGMAVGIPSQLLVQKLINKKAGNVAAEPTLGCTGPNCGHDHGHVVQMEALPAACTGANCAHDHAHDHAHTHAEAPAPPPAVCTGPNCANHHHQAAVAPALKESPTHVFQVEGSKANSIKTYLEAHGSAVQVSEMREGGSGIVEVTLENAKVNAAKLVEMIQKDLGFIVRHGMIFCFIFCFF